MSLPVNSDSRIYVGNLPPDVHSKDVEELFDKYGSIEFVDLKNRRGPPFAFIEFKDVRDAEDAVRGRDGYDFDGCRLRVEFPRGKGPRGPGGRPLAEGGRGRDEGYGDRGDRGGKGGGSKRTSHRVKITGLPDSGSWQDLKDHMREAGDVCYSDVSRDGTGIVEYLRYEDMKYALRKLDDTKFRSHEGETSYVRVSEDNSGDRNGSERGGRGGGRSRSRSPVKRDRSPVRRSRASPSYSPARRSRSRSRSKSPY